MTPTAALGGATLQTRILASKDVKLSLAGDSIIVSRGGRVTCLVPLANVAFILPAKPPPPAEAKTEAKTEAKK